MHDRQATTFLPGDITETFDFQLFSDVFSPDLSCVFLRHAHAIATTHHETQKCIKFGFELV